MYNSVFPINDLFRRKILTSLTIISLTLCVASTLFLLLFSERVGLRILSVTGGKLTYGFSIIFAQFIAFLGICIFIAGALIISFITLAMMHQRARDIGLIKTIGCPNDLIFGYFMTELMILTFSGCFLGVILGITADSVSSNLLSTLQIAQKSIDFRVVLLVFVLFFVLALIFGVKTIYGITRTEPTKAISPIHNLGLITVNKFRVLSKLGLTLQIAVRSLCRRKSAAIKIILCLSSVFLLATLAIAGSVIANQTTKKWIENAIGKDVILIAQESMSNQYRLLLSKFSGVNEKESQFNYRDEEYLIPTDIIDKLYSTSGVSDVDTRLVLRLHVEEVRNYTFNPETGATKSIGSNREGECLVVGIEPKKTLSDWYLQGKFLKEEQVEAIVGDSLAQKMFSMPLLQSVRLLNKDFSIKGVCIDPIENGNVIYVPFRALQNITGISKPNIVMVKITSDDYLQTVNQIKEKIGNTELTVCELNDALDKNIGFLNFIWSTIMFLPIFSLVSVSSCLIVYVILNIEDQRQEFGILRSIGAKPRAIVNIVITQNILIMLSSFTIGMAFGIIIILLILVPDPFVTIFTILEIAGWMLGVLASIFLASIYPAMKFAKKPILKIIADG